MKFRHEWKNKKMFKICCIVLAANILLSAVIAFVWFKRSDGDENISNVGIEQGYENRLFDTGNMVHNYYLYEKSGHLSMIPWDYNLAFGTFQDTNAEVAVNDPIESPLYVSSASERTMMGWFLSNEEYTAMCKQYFDDFITMYFDGGKLEKMINFTKKLIAPYVEKDPTKFCEYEEFEKGR